MARIHAIAGTSGFVAMPRAETRSILVSEGAHALALWCELRMRATYAVDGVSIDVDGELIHLDAGQCLVSQRDLAKTIGMSRGFVEKCLRRWAERGLIKLAAGRSHQRSRGGSHLRSHVRSHPPTVVTIADLWAYAQSTGEREATSEATSEATPEATSEAEKNKVTTKKKEAFSSSDLVQAQMLYNAIAEEWGQPRLTDANASALADRFARFVRAMTKAHSGFTVTEFFSRLRSADFLREDWRAWNFGWLIGTKRGAHDAATKVWLFSYARKSRGGAAPRGQQSPHPHAPQLPGLAV